MKTNKPRRQFVVPFTIATRVLATGQRLRANETASATTFALTYAAKFAQATENRRAARG